jgi:thioredoxin 1
MSDKALQVTEASWEAEVLAAKTPVLVDFWAPWCGPCRFLGPTIEKLAEEFEGRVRVVKVNVDEAPVLASQFGIASIPTLMLFRDGEVVDHRLGARPEAELRELMLASLEAAAPAPAAEPAPGVVVA